MNKKPARVISGGRLTIPKEFREQHDLDEGDRVWVHVEPIEQHTEENPYSRADVVRDL